MEHGQIQQKYSRKYSREGQRKILYRVAEKCSTVNGEKYSTGRREKYSTAEEREIL